ncbi:MAG: methylated-DNA--[protein]-cysteine S-methyltransferase [Fibrobacteraceae bacterium]|nr:methylated-DNA--[protein]-cysteine S-methyltransferase [Fibrobacteraceae bacterium]
MDYTDPKFTAVHHRNVWGQWIFIFEKSKLCGLSYTGSNKPSSVKACAYAGSNTQDNLPPTVARAYHKAVRLLNQYLDGKLKEFSIPLQVYGTEFQKKVWKAISEIPYGQTRTYQQIASEIGAPKALRAVGGALHANPIAIILPCHRVVGKKGKMVGYAMGIDLKRRLLMLEGAIQNELELE